MAMIRKGRLNERFRRVVIGCGVQGEECLALSVRRMGGVWHVPWALFGVRGDCAFARVLSKRVYRRPWWTAPWGLSPSTETTVRAVELDFPEENEANSTPRLNVQAALRTQVLGRFPFASEPSILRGIELQGPDGRSHVVGAAARKDIIEQEYRDWRSNMGIIYPHIGSNAVALVNMFLALYPESRRDDSSCRVLVLAVRDTTHAVLMDNWRLIESVQYQMMEGQVVDSDLLYGFIQHFQEHNRLEGDPIPCLIQPAGFSNLGDGIETWDPFEENRGLTAAELSRRLMAEHFDLALLAFGMALQGG